jgi:hypothetical protein
MAQANPESSRVRSGCRYTRDRAIILCSRIVKAVPYPRRRGIEKGGRTAGHTSSNWKTAFASCRASKSSARSALPAPPRVYADSASPLPGDSLKFLFLSFYSDATNLIRVHEARQSVSQYLSIPSSGEQRNTSEALAAISRTRSTDASAKSFQHFPYASLCFIGSFDSPIYCIRNSCRCRGRCDSRLRLHFRRGSGKLDSD